jgi:hypothetical protein
MIKTYQKGLVNLKLEPVTRSSKSQLLRRGFFGGPFSDLTFTSASFSGKSESVFQDRNEFLQKNQPKLKLKLKRKLS